MMVHGPVASICICICDSYGHTYNDQPLETNMCASGSHKTTTYCSPDVQVISARKNKTLLLISNFPKNVANKQVLAIQMKKKNRNEV